MPVDPIAEHLPLGFVAARRIVLRTLDVGCDRGHGGSLGLGLSRTPANSLRQPRHHVPGRRFSRERPQALHPPST